MKNLKTFLISLILGLLSSGQVMAIEEPKYEVLLTDGPYEIRQYAPTLIAETIAAGDMDEASNKGFRLIADFIFGNNQVAQSLNSEKTR
jgi:SOUL heme-binding protein